MTPLREIPEPGTPEERFNNAFKSGRSIIERCNGVLKNRFRCLLKDRVLHYHPVKASKIVKACAVLHNMCCNANIPEPAYDHENIVIDGIFHNIPFNDEQNNDLERARVLQRAIIQNHFG